MPERWILVDDFDWKVVIDYQFGRYRARVHCPLPNCPQRPMQTDNCLNSDDALSQATMLAELHCKRHFPNPRTATASAFADWVFRKDHAFQLAALNLESSEQPETEMATAHAQLIREYKPPPGWTIEYRDEADQPDLLASKLVFRGQQLTGRPDIVLASEDQSRIRIVEFKVRRYLSSQWFPHGYIDNQAQLWCYCWLDNWQHKNVAGVILYHQPSIEGWRLFETVPVDRTNTQWHSTMADLWARYGGEPVRLHDLANS